MKKLFDKVGKKRETNTLVGKVVLVGQFSVKVEALIGEGGFATIYRCVDIKSGHTFALKHLRLGADPESIKEVQQEAKTMARLKGHPNILKLHAVAFAGPKGGETDGFMLLDFCPLTLLEVMQRANFALDDYLVYEVFQDVVWAVAHMHKCNPPLAHRDLKAENVLKNSEGRWVICDFGSSTARAQVYDTPAEIAMEEDNIRRTTTPAYRAPEMWDLYSRQRIDTAVDVWALGVLLYVLAFGKLPFQGDSKLSILYGKYDMPPGRPAALRSLIQDMLQVNAKDRPDIFQVISKLDVLRAVLSGDPSAGDSPPAPPPPQPPQQQQALLPPPAGPHPHPHPHPHQQAGAPMPYPSQQPPNAPSPHHHASGVPQGPYPGVPGAGPPPPHLQRSQPPAANGQTPGPWPNGPSPPPPQQHNNLPHVPAHMQPPPHGHPPQPHQPHPHPYPAVPHGPPPSQQQLYPPLLQGPGSGHLPAGPPHPGAGPGPGSAGPGQQPRPAGPGAPPVLRVPSRQGSFTPSWPATSPPGSAAAAAAPPPLQRPPSQPQAGAAAVPASPAVPQLVNLMDAEPMQPSAPAPGTSWERPGPMDAPAGPGPGSAAYARSGQLNQHRRTGSHTELHRGQPAAAAVGPGATSAAAGAGVPLSSSSHAAVGFGDDNVDWGEQPAFISSSSQLPSQQFEASDFAWMDGVVTPILSSATAAAPTSAASVTAVGTVPPAPPIPQSSANSVTSQAQSALAGPSPSPASATALSAAPSAHSAILRTASAVPAGAAAAATPPPPPQGVPQEAAGAVPRSATAPPAASVVTASFAAAVPTAAAPTAAAPPTAGAAGAHGAFPPEPAVAGGSAEGMDGLRAQVQRLTSANGQLEGRVRQLEEVVASQAAMIHRLALELRALMQQQQQQQLQQPSLQDGRELPKHHHQNELPAATARPQELQQQQLADDVNCVAVNSAGELPRAPAIAASAAGVVSDDAAGRGRAGGACGGRPGSPARASAPAGAAAVMMGSEPEPWGASLVDPSPPSGSAIYPPLRYEDLA